MGNCGGGKSPQYREEADGSWSPVTANGSPKARNVAGIPGALGHNPTCQLFQFGDQDDQDQDEQYTGWVCFAFVFGISACICCLTSQEFSDLAAYCAPLWLGVTLHCMRSTLGFPKVGVRSVTFLFLGYSCIEYFYLRGYTVACREKWRYELAVLRANGTISVVQEEDVVLNCLVGLDDWENWTPAKRAKCCPETGVCQQASTVALSTAAPPAPAAPLVGTATLSQGCRDATYVGPFEADHVCEAGLTCAGYEFGVALGQCLPVNADAVNVNRKLLVDDAFLAAAPRVLQGGGFAEAAALAAGEQEFDVATSPVPVAQGITITKAPTRKAVSDRALGAYCASPYVQDMSPADVPKLARCHGNELCMQTLGWVNTCPAWTCSYSLIKHASWKVWALLAGSAVVTFFYVTSVVHSLEFVGVGSCQDWVIWYWTFAIPALVFELVTFCRGYSLTHIVGQVPKIMSVLVQDIYAITITASTVIGVVIIFWNRKKIYSALGIEDTSFVRLSVKDVWQRGWRAKMDHFQICIYCVFGKDPNMHEADDELQSSSKHDMKVEGLLPNQGQAYSMFVRIGYGDNEPQMTRVVSGSRMTSNTKIYYRQVFQLNMQDDPLYITVRDQQVISSSEISRFVLDGRKLRRMLSEATDRERRDKRSEEHLSSLQVQAMLKTRVTPEHIDYMTSELDFKVHSLTGGGGIMFAISPMSDD